jgi:hypothetical protein
MTSKKGKIAVEQNLAPVADYLSQQGYTVEKFNASNMLLNKKDYDALVISGGSENFLGFEDRTTTANIINASGLSPEDVARRLESR